MAQLEALPTTGSGSVRKSDAMDWLDSLDDPDDGSAMVKAIVPKPKNHSGSTFAEDIGNVRVTGDAEFIEEVARHLKPFLKAENHRTRLSLNVQKVEDRDSGELTDNYALYLSVAERG